MKAKVILRRVGAVLGTAALLVAVLYCNHDIGIPQSRIEQDIRASQKIQPSWITEGYTADTMAAYISYSEDHSDHTFSVYVNRPGLSFGYFFRAGGNLTGVERYITEFTVEDYRERAFVSMNQQKVALLEIDDGSILRKIALDAEKPFAFVLPDHMGTVAFFDENGDPVEYVEHRL